MSATTIRYKKRKLAKQIIEKIFDNKSEYLIIHYSCESFFNIPDGNTPRITSIAVRQVKSSQTKSFSIHKIAELKHMPSTEIKSNYNVLEKEMLDEFYTFLKENKDKKWIHINMRNINYGFEAINHRYKVLGGDSIEIPDTQKIDLAELFIDLYGKQYAPHPRFESLYKMNKITMISFLSGKEEAEAFEEERYVALHQSTLRKVDNMFNVLTLCIEQELKINSNFFQIYGLTPAGIFYAAKDNWFVAMILFFAGILASKLI